MKNMFKMIPPNPVKMSDSKEKMLMICSTQMIIRAVAPIMFMYLASLRIFIPIQVPFSSFSLFDLPPKVLKFCYFSTSPLIFDIFINYNKKDNS